MILSFQNISAQQPSYFVLGEDLFKGIQVYDVIQDDKQNYWYATNDGIFCFNGLSFERIECWDAKSNSVFNFVRDKQGIIYCHNLNNQIFKIQNKKATLFYELNEDEGGTDVSLSIDSKGHLLVSSKQVLVIDKSGKPYKRFNSFLHYISQPFKTEDGSIFYHLSGTDSLLFYKDDHFFIKEFKTDRLKNKNINVLKFFKFNNKINVLDLTSKKSYNFNLQKLEIIELEENPIYKQSESVRIYETKKGIWVVGTKHGIIFVDKKHPQNPKLLYTSYFISDVYEDVEGNVLLSTFDKGVLVISNINTPDVINSFLNDPVTYLYSFSKDKLILGTSKGQLLSYQNGIIQTIKNSGTRPIGIIKGNQKSPWIIFDDSYIRAYNPFSCQTIDIHEASLKAIVFISPKLFYIGTNRGVFSCKIINNTDFTVEPILNLQNRVHSMEYDSINDLIYISTANGLILLDNKKQIKTLKYLGDDIFPNDIYFSKGQIYLTTKKNGILIYKKDKNIGQIFPKINGEKQVLKKIIIFKNTIIASAMKGFYQFNLNGKYLKYLSSADDFTSNRVIDFTIHNGKLWVSHTRGVQEIDLNSHFSNAKNLLIRIDRLVVNDQIVKVKTKYSFESHQRKIQFYFSTPTLRNRGTIQYHYRLLGLESNWTTTDFNIKQVSYNALPPGIYEFQIRIENQGTFSKTRSIFLTIATPLYYRWWFISLSILSIIGIIIGIYRWQLSVQKKKSKQINELNASKLTAIQSQMNPHFIFNSLNSIQDLILKGDVEHSYSYITTFSNLVRRTLNYSEKDFIDFEQEIKLLELYLSLEKLRFKKDFNYSIEYKGIEDLMLPPLLIQPFIENSLIHGLLHKDGSKNLKITFNLTDVFTCRIEDNGIGREASQLIKERQRAEHESFSSKAIKKRFEILSTALEGQFGYEYEDLKENGIAIGTIVKLIIPFKHKF